MNTPTWLRPLHHGLARTSPLLGLTVLLALPLAVFAADGAPAPASASAAAAAVPSAATTSPPAAAASTPSTPAAAAAPASPADAPAPVTPPSAPSAGATGAAADTASEGGATRALDEQVQDLKKQVVALNRDLFVLEEELLFPANTQVAVFVSVDVGDFFSLDSIDLKIDSHEVSNYLYTPREVAALLKGATQRLYVGNVKAGQHELVAFFNGKGPHDRYYKRGATLKFEKGVGAKYLELKISDHGRAQQPEFEVKDWE